MYDVPSTVRPPTLAERIEFVALPVLGVLLTLVSALAVERYPSFRVRMEQLIRQFNLSGLFRYGLQPFGVTIGIAVSLSHTILLRSLRWRAKLIWITTSVVGASLASSMQSAMIYQQWETHTLGPRTIAWMPASHAILWSVGVVVLPQVVIAAMHRRRQLWSIIVGTTVGWVLVWISIATVFQETMRMNPGIEF